MSKEYEVGYKKPPADTRFKKGRSGNPAGRPRRKEPLPNIEPVLKTALNSPVTVNDNGTLRQITKIQAIITQLVNKAASGHLSSIKLLMPVLGRFAELASEMDSEAQAEADAESFERLMKRLDETLERNRQCLRTFGLGQSVPMLASRITRP